MSAEIRLDRNGSQIIIPRMQRRNILRAIAAAAPALLSFAGLDRVAPGRIGGSSKLDAKLLVFCLRKTADEVL
jgi:hypothetical protein